MIDSSFTAGASGSEARGTWDNHFGWLRTRLSLERTIMSWLRTAMALIALGFVIVQYCNHLHGSPSAPLYLKPALIISVILALVVAIEQYWWGVRYLCSETYVPIAGIGGERSAVARNWNRHPSHLYWSIRVLCRTVATGLTAKHGDHTRTTANSEPRKGDHNG
jgi:putative membrane protein